MSTLIKATLSEYRYDALDSLSSQTFPNTPVRRQFYCKSRLTTEIQAGIGRTIVQHENLLLAEQQHESAAITTRLLATDLQRSVLHTLAGTQRQAIGYSPYGHHRAESGLSSLLGFNGERPDPVTRHYLLGNGYRAFNPVLMRFNSPDKFCPFGKGGLNAYGYCQGDPINFTDPSGASAASMINYFARMVGLKPTLHAPGLLSKSGVTFATGRKAYRELTQLGLERQQIISTPKLLKFRQDANALAALRHIEPDPIMQRSGLALYGGVDVFQKESRLLAMYPASPQNFLKESLNNVQEHYRPMFKYLKEHNLPIDQAAPFDYQFSVLRRRAPRKLTAAFDSYSKVLDNISHQSTHDLDKKINLIRSKYFR